MEQTQVRFPVKVRQFVNDMLAVNTKASIYAILPMYDKYYHHQRDVVERASAFSQQLNGSEDGAKLRMAIQIYNQSIVRRVFNASPPPQPVINPFMR
jgi:hypothetical protein